ncbi:MAG: dihydroorotase [Nitrososphaeria archaeon]
MLTRIVNGKVWLNGRIFQKDIIIEDDLIKEVIRKSQHTNVDRILDAEDALILPGLVDSHTHLRDGLQAYKEDFVSGTSSAVAGGFTLVMDMPNSIPPITTPQRLIDRMNLAVHRILCDVGFHSMPTQREHVLALKKAGCIGYKIYTHKTFEDAVFSTKQSLVSLFEEVSGTNIPLSIHAEDPSLLIELEGDYNAQDHARAHPREAEISMVNTIIEVAEMFPVRTRICHVTTSESLQAISRSRQHHCNIHSEVTPSHLTFDRSIYGDCKKICTVEPPFREHSDVVSLRNSLWKGEIDIIGTDHAPHHESEKISGRPAPGFPNLETAVPVLLTLAKKGYIPLSDTIESLTAAPASFFSLRDHGSIDSGKVANLTFVKFVPEYEIDPSKFCSKAKFSPFKGFKAEAAVVRTIVRGETAYSRKEGVSDIRKGKVVGR